MKERERERESERLSTATTHNVIQVLESMHPSINLLHSQSATV